MRKYCSLPHAKKSNLSPTSSKQALQQRKKVKLDVFKACFELVGLKLVFDSKKTPIYCGKKSNLEFRPILYPKNEFKMLIFYSWFSRGFIQITPPGRHLFGNWKKVKFRPILPPKTKIELSKKSNLALIELPYIVYGHKKTPQTA